MQIIFKFSLVLIIALYGSQHAFSIHPEDNYGGNAMYGAPTVPHIALLLPLESPTFGATADIVKQGFVTAIMREDALPLIVRIYPTSGDPLDTLIIYQEAINEGAIMVVGPLTRDGVTALASSHMVNVPTLTLNAIDDNGRLPSNLYLFGLQMDNEAEQIAKLASEENKHHAIIISDNSPLSIRLQTAFIEEWQQHKSYATTEHLSFNPDQEILKTLRRNTAGSNNIIFLALDAEKSRLIRSYLDPNVPVYATSQIFNSDQDSLFNHDLNNTKFLEMPWLLQPDHPAVMAYKRSETPLSTDMERFYALGIDAFRLMALLFQAHSPRNVSLDGVTGHIRLAPPNQFIREPFAATFHQGQVMLLNPPEEEKSEVKNEER